MSAATQGHQPRMRYEDWKGFAWRFRAFLPDGTYLATNNEGDGLFQVTTDGNVRQLRGNGQFSARTLQEFGRNVRAFRRAQRAGW
jgi:hypothetical protein